MDLSVVIPVYQSSSSLPELVERLFAVLDETGLVHEVVLVDDASTDGSWGVVRRLHAEHPGRIVAIQLVRNSGQHNAIMCGFRHARGRFVATMDDDLQHPPEELPRLLEEIQRRDLDVVYGFYRIKRHSALRQLVSAPVMFFYRVTFRSNTRVSSFRCIRRELVQAILPYRRSFTVVDGLLAFHTHRIGYITVDHHPRKHGRSTYTLGRLVGLALDFFVGFSILPVRAIGLLGVFLVLAGVAEAAVGVVLGGLGSLLPPDGPAQGARTTFLFGLAIGAIAIVGEYVGRLVLDVTVKPQFVEREVLSRAEPETKG